ncbi:DnaB-like helicase N-terminal domain-containing protein [Actinophytocola oryzae]|uniref:Replicative DNA helicase n=1 Tax=Actinophytocola oryzae TaxID=502181 RepID=A0A4R7UTV8_9PSEU|nr:DnaB-like helicase N-terminal domain-containing protein [Actinophytocola oryzae]TDV40108.1 replicative DNA helicase [Actinophytocola oryzae]
MTDSPRLHVIDGYGAHDDPMPPWSEPAEQAVLGAVLQSEHARAEVAEIVERSDFFKPAHAAIYAAVHDLAGSGRPVDAVTIVDELERRGELRRVGGAPYLHTCIAACPAPVSAGHYAEIVRDKAEDRRLIMSGQRLTQLASRPPGDERRQAVHDEFAAVTTALSRGTAGAGEHLDHLNRFVDGAAFLLDAPNDMPAVWGNGNDVLWAEGEALMICGGNGVGKTTLAAQLVRCRLNLDTDVLGYPVKPGARRVLYLAMDRPAQIQRALRRAFDPEERQVLADALVFWKGPPVADMAERPFLLRQMCEQADADTVIVDSLKDAAIGLSADEVGAGWNRARQAAVSSGIEVLELHHLVKRNANGGRPESIEDVYGSAWLTAGLGSAILLDGAPGDPLVKFKHLKQPMNELGPWEVVHDHDHGVSSIRGQVDPLQILRAQSSITAKALAEIMFDGAPKPAQVEKARRALERLSTAKLAWKVSPGGTQPAVYYAAATPDVDEP